MDEAAAIAQFAYVEGESLESRLDLMVANGEASAAAKLMLNFVSRLRSLPTLVPFESSYEFRRWFGDISEDKIRCLDEAGNEIPVMSLPVTDIDMIPQNILLTDDKAILIDYEWTFSCAVPVDYVVFRFLYYFLEGKHRLQYKHPEFENLYRQAGITESVKQFFLIMETHFQEYVQQSAMVLRNEYEMFGKPLIRRWQLQSLLMGSTGHAITVRYPSQHEEVISSIPMDRSDLVDGKRREEVYHYKIPVTENGEMILILPSVRLLRIGILSVSGGRSREQEFLVNGDQMAGCVYSFENPEPKISVDVSTNQASYLMLSLEEIPVSKDAYTEISAAINDFKFLADLLPVGNVLKLRNSLHKGPQAADAAGNVVWINGGGNAAGSFPAGLQIVAQGYFQLHLGGIALQGHQGGICTPVCNADGVQDIKPYVTVDAASGVPSA